MKTSSSIFYGVSKIGSCHGYYECQNSDCPKKQAVGAIDTSQWHYNDSVRVCFNFGVFATNIPCGKRKLTLFSRLTTVEVIYNLGEHTCSLKPNLSKYDVSIRRQLKGNEHLGPCHLQRKLVNK